MNIYGYDFETFKKDWCVVFENYETKDKTIIENNRDEFLEFYETHKNDIFVGYNSRNFDQFIFKGILGGLDPYKITDAIINKQQSGYSAVPCFNDYPLYNFDIQTGFHGLKQLEGFMGSTIKESSVDFNISRKLTKTEMAEVIEYCIHDVEETMKVFEYRKEEFDSQLLMIEMFSLSMEMFTKTKAQLAAIILGAKRIENFHDEFELIFPDTLVLSEKYQYILDWYKNPQNMNYKKSLKTDVAGVPHIFAWGGLHGATSNYSAEGIILCCDVASLYPSLMIEYGFVSRAVPNPEVFRDMRDTRLRLKAKKDKMQAPLKIVINGSYGAMKDKYNEMYDPRMANNVCIAGQLLLLDLIEKIEPHCQLIQLT